MRLETGLPIVQMRDVSKTYNGGDVPFVALNRVSMDIRQGEFLGITGRSGAGKTTLLNMLSGVDELTAGSVFFHWRGEKARSSAVQVNTLSEDALARWRGENLGIIYQSFELMPTLSLLENVMLPMDFSGGYRRQKSPQRAMELLELVEIAEHAYKIPAHISGGQKQRVAIARALVNDPHLIIADEPTGNLDSGTADVILRLFERLVAHGKTIVMVTHDESFASRFTRRLVIADGVVGGAAGDGSSTASAPAHDAATSAPISVRTRGTRPAPAAAHVDRPSAPAIVLRGVDKVYENAAGRFKALQSINLQVGQGQFVSVVGQSGCGKSTLLNMITGIDHPTSGEVVVGGKHIYRMNESERALWRGRNLGVVFQFFQLLPTLSLLENTMLPMDYCNLYPFSERAERAMELLRLVGVDGQADKLPTAVSSGQQQEAAIARALATDPPIVVADEPTGNLDSRSAENVLDLFERLARSGKTILIVTHDPSIAQRTDHMIILSDGELVDRSVPRALPFLSHPSLQEAVSRARRRHVPAGAMILQPGRSPQDLYMVVGGEVEVFARKPDARETRIARLASGKFFGAVELGRGADSRAGVRALSGGAELAVLPRGIVDELMNVPTAGPVEVHGHDGRQVGAT